jgi:hypothetical protein
MSRPCQVLGVFFFSLAGGRQSRHHGKRQKRRSITLSAGRNRVVMRMRLRNAERSTLAKIGKRLGRKAVASLAQFLETAPLTNLLWWRRGELNPRPRKLIVKRLRAYPAQKSQRPPQNRRKQRQPSPIEFQPPAPDRSLWPIPQNDAHSPPRGLSGWSGYLIN